MVPTVELPPAIPFTDQATVWSLIPVTVAANCSLSPARIWALGGVTETSAVAVVVVVVVWGVLEFKRLQPVANRSARLVAAAKPRNLQGKFVAVLIAVEPLSWRARRTVRWVETNEKLRRPDRSPEFHCGSWFWRFPLWA